MLDLHRDYPSLEHAYARVHRAKQHLTNFKRQTIKETDETFFNRLLDARRAVAGTHKGIPLDLLVLTPWELKNRLDRGDQFIKDITEKGQLLYAA